MSAKPAKKKKAKVKPAPASKDARVAWSSLDVDKATIALFLEAARAARIDAWMERMREKKRKQVEAEKRERAHATKALFRSALPGLLAKEGMPVDHVEPHMLRIDDRKYDFVARSGKMNFVGEIKVRFRVRDLALLVRLLMKFREDCPELAGDRPIYGVVCGMVVDEDAANIARKEGFLVVDGRTEAKLHMPPRIQDH